MHAFEVGQIRFQPKVLSKNGYLWGNYQYYRNFENLTSFIPFELPQNEHKNLRMKSCFDLDFDSHAKNLEMISQNKGQLRKIGKVAYNRKVAIIYNPNSGKKRDIRAQLISTLTSKKIQYQIYETKGYMDAWQIVQNIPFEEHSAIVAVGGDGTLHEVVNGMMF